MPIAIFENLGDDPLTFTIEPRDDTYEVPPLARIGVRYTLRAGAEDRTSASYADRSISFWCDAKMVEVEIVHPGAFDRLLWALCVKHGCCGSFIDGQDRQVTDYLPTSGIVTAGQFADLAVKAENYAEGESASRERSRPRLAALFREHMGSESVPAENLVRNLANPFAGPAPA
ncbi:hypothetical protein [Sphingomonas sp. G-3-2-10]|uniref:hypothetical protein n=1 Tax=Sphingomonas sp. G-3-2-10 TaxID=2728838 RepID=UPI00146C3B1D|nr:hypothetical protein [Sphingomonas sp. G-3-2-10]NML06511.1 hypothetical protein [Sphingomonas sp. G-3-2-10]